MRVILVVVMLGLSGCFREVPPPTASITMPTPDSDGWQILAPGLEQRTYTPDDNLFKQVVVLRIDPAQYHFRVHYGDPLRLSEWKNALPDVFALVNANFFDREGNALGLVIADGVVSGQAYTNRGGMFAIQDGLPRITSNITEPYQGEILEQAVQAFPMLIQGGQQSYVEQRGESVSRRTVVAIDAQGRVLLMATPLTGMSLIDLATFLANSDLQIVDALNLDGGGSTMMGTSDFTITSFDSVPVVLAVYGRPD